MLNYIQIKVGKLYYFTNILEQSLNVNKKQRIILVLSKFNEPGFGFYDHNKYIKILIPDNKIISITDYDINTFYFFKEIN